VLLNHPIDEVCSVRYEGQRKRIHTSLQVFNGIQLNTAILKEFICHSLSLSAMIITVRSIVEGQDTEHAELDYQTLWKTTIYVIIISYSNMPRLIECKDSENAVLSNPVQYAYCHRHDSTDGSQNLTR
jgi:hypothetical protein